MTDLSAINELLADLEHAKSINRLAHYEPYKFQAEFHNAVGHGTAKPAQQRMLMCANKVGKCATIHTIVDTDEGRKSLVEIWGKSVNVLTWPNKEPRRVSAWVKKPPEECFRIVMSDGRFVEVPSGHVVLTAQGWLSIGEIFSYLPQSVFLALGPLGSVRIGVSRLLGRLRGYWDRCFADFRLRGGRLLSDQEGVRVFSPLQDGVQGHSLAWLRLGDLVRRCTSIVRQVCDLLSISGVDLRFSAQCGPYLDQESGRRDLSQNGCSPSFRQSSITACLEREEREALQDQSSFSSFFPDVDGNKIVLVYSIGVHPIYDMVVEDRHNYLAGGLVNHNTYGSAMEVAIHATGRYPSWWRGTRFLYAPEILVSGLTNDSVRDLGQRELFGDPTDEKQLGKGTIPKECIGKRRNKTGVPNAFDSVRVQHVSGRWATIYFRAYEQGWKKFQGIGFEVAWADEEPPIEIWSQLIRGTLARKNAIIFCSMTPEEGMTEVVTGFMERLQPGQALITATWDDAKHLTPEVKAQRLAALRPHERDMRSKGIPLQGAGLIFSVSDADIVVPPIAIPDHWAQIIGIDFGISTQHPFSAAKLAIDRDTDTTYLTAEYQTTNEAAAMHVDAIKPWGDWIPVSWPHDGMNREKGSGDELQAIYRKKGLTNLLPWKATNPPDPSIGQQEGDGGNSLEKSVLDMLDAMLSGKFKVFSTCTTWLKEKRLYHRDLKGKIVRLNEDLICASRYAFMMRRHADSLARRRAVQSRANRDRQAMAVGLRNW